MEMVQVQTTLSNQIQQPGIYGYRLVAYPDKELTGKIIEEKKSFDQQYGCTAAIKQRPFITIAGFQAREEMEETLIRYMQRICNRLHSFCVELNNYSGFPPHSVHLRVQNPQPFRQIAKDLEVINNYISSCACPPLSLVSTPHISIANQLDEQLYLKALLDYGQKTFHEIFIVTELLLVRQKHTQDELKPINVFGLLPAEKTFYN